MTDKTKLVLKGFFDLSDDERSEFIDELNKYLKSPTPQQKRLLREGIEKSAEKIVLGPLDGSCPCCGR